MGMWTKDAVLAFVLILMITPSLAYLQSGSLSVSADGAPSNWRATPPIQVVSPTSISPSFYVSNLQVYHAYGLDNLTCSHTGYVWGDAHLCGYGQAIGIVDAFDDPTLQSDLNSSTSLLGLPSCTTGNGCLVKATPQGVPAPDSGWDLEISLDVQWAHAIAPGAKIVLVEAADNSFNKLLAGVDYAASYPGVHQVSMSWGGGEFSGETSFDTHFNVSGVSFFASSGDNGHEVLWPAASPSVVGTGGTSLTVDSNGNVLSETAWVYSGGGISAYEPEPSFQTAFGVSSGGLRGIPDVSYDSDPNSGVQVYSGGSLFQVGGTSAASPQWAALFAIVNSYRSTPISSVHFGTSAALYAAATGSSNASRFRDITSGTNGACGSLCTASPGYDFITGLGSPHADTLVPYLVSNVTSPALVPLPNVVVGTVPTPFSANVTNPASAASNLTGVAFSAPAGWTFGGSPTAPAGWSMASNSTSIVNFTSSAGLRPGFGVTFDLGLLRGPNATASPSALSGVFATSISDNSSSAHREGPTLTVYSIAATNVSLTLSPTITSYAAYSLPYVATATLSSRQSGVPVSFSAPGYPSSSIFNFTPAASSSNPNGTTSTIFQPSDSPGDASAVVATLGDSGISGTSPVITTVASTLSSLVVRGDGNSIWMRSYNSSTGVWGNWTALPGATSNAPASTVMGNQLHLVVDGLSPAGSLFYGYLNESDLSFSGWTLLSSPPGGLAASGPTLTSNSTTLVLVVRGQDNLIYYRFCNVTSQSWTDWVALPLGSTPDSPSAAVLGNALNFVVRGMDGSSIWYCSVNLSTMAFSGWQLMVGSTQSRPTLATSQSLGELFLVVRGLDNGIWFNTWNSTWGNWTEFPNGRTPDGAGATVIGVTLQVVVRGTDGSSIWFESFDTQTMSASGWTQLTGEMTYAATLTS